MGLLDKVITVEGYSTVSADRVNETLNGSGKGLLETAPVLFSLLTEMWNLDKCALLVLRGEEYLPAEICGLDVTTKRRLRFNKALFSNCGGDPFLKDVNEEWSAYFSLRESGQLRALVFLPFFKGDTDPFALFMIPLDDEGKDSMTSASCPFIQDEELMSRLYKSLNPSSGGNRPMPEVKSSEDIRKELLTESDNRVLLSLSLGAVITKVNEIDPLKDPYQSRNDLLSLFASFFNERVSLYLDKEDRLLISQPAELFPGEKLFRHQILLSLKQLFGETFTDDILIVDSLLNRSSPEELDKFLAH